MENLLMGQTSISQERIILIYKIFNKTIMSVVYNVSKLNMPQRGKSNDI